MSASLLRRGAPAKAALFAMGCFGAIAPAYALSIEEARTACRETVGHPIVQACMQGMGKGPDREANLTRCRAGAAPKVHACVQAALNKANGRANVAITPDVNGTKPQVDPRRALTAGFVPPPRTITDITAVLEKEKPTPERLAAMKAEADAEPSRGSAGSARFFSIAAMHGCRSVALATRSVTERLLCSWLKETFVSVIAFVNSSLSSRLRRGIQEARCRRFRS